jgi:hypothetical protein
LFSSLYSQTNDYNELLDSAKNMYKKQNGLIQDELDQFDYNNLIELLEHIVDIQPNNIEARYFLGYTYSKLNSRDGRGMMHTNKDLVEKSSTQFEEIIKLAPKYSGEIIVLDPYSKISSEWGSLAMSYWYRNQKDSAYWAFNQGKKRGGFSDFVLELNKKFLDACSPNAILISSGDNFTFALWYLQILNNYRKDVSVIDVSLLNTTWFPTYLSKNNLVGFDIPNSILDTIEYITWSDSIVSINNFSWTVKPSLYDTYLIRGDRLLLSMLKQNQFQRDFYFTIAFAEESRLSLKNFINKKIIIDQLTTQKVKELSYTQYKSTMESVLSLSKFINVNSTDEIWLYDIFRYELFGKIYDYISKNDKQKAKELLLILDTYGHENKIPYKNEEGKKYAETLREIL